MSSLPNELIIMVAEFLEKEADINALARTNSRFYHLLNRYLYRQNIKYKNSALVWAIENDNISTARKAVEAGASADEALGTYTHPCYSPTSLAKMGHLVPVAPLALAMKFGKKEIVELLLTQDIDFTKFHWCYSLYPRILGAYVLCKAVDNDDPALFHVLLDRVSDILLERDTPPENKRWRCCVSIVIEHIVNAGEIPLLEEFLSRGFSLYESQFESKEVLYKGANDKTMFNFLLKHGLDCSLSLDESLLFLGIGMGCGNPAAIDYALDQYSSYYSESERPLTFNDIQRVFASGDSMWKRWYGCDEDTMQITVQHLINRGVDPNPKTSWWAFDTVTDVLFYRHETVMQTMIQGCYARGVTTAELNEGIRSCPDVEDRPFYYDLFSKWWQKYLVT